VVESGELDTVEISQAITEQDEFMSILDEELKEWGDNQMT